MTEIFCLKFNLKANYLIEDRFKINFHYKHIVSNGNFRHSRQERN